MRTLRSFYAMRARRNQKSRGMLQGIIEAETESLLRHAVCALPRKVFVASLSLLSTL